MDQLKKLGPFAALGRLWNDLSSAQRAVVVAFVAVAVVVGTFVTMIASKPRMAVLFSGLAGEDAGAIAQKLNDDKVPYQLTGDGGTIEVPADKVHDLRLKMATQGLPQGGSVGFELFDKSNFGMTEFAEKLNYQRAISGELTRTISQLRPVLSARVHISLPEDKVFASEQQPAKASIALKIRRGVPLSDEQVGGIVHLVASAVEGLKPENVDVIDQDGNVLSESSSSGSHGMLNASQSKLKRQYENEVAHNLQSMLTRIVGADKAVVRVSADMNFDQRQTRSETYQPASERVGSQQDTGQSATGVMLSQETSSEDYSGSVIPPAIQGVTTGISSSTGDKYSRSTTTAQYQVSKTIEETTVAPGQVKRLSVAVLVDKSVSGIQVGHIRQAVNAAAGIDQDRGDQVTVQAVAFDTSTQKQVAKEMATASRNELIATIAKNAGAVILLIGFLLLLRSIVMGIKLQAPATNPSAAVKEEAEHTSVAQAVAQMQPERTEPHTAQSESGSKSELPPEVSESNPEDLARLVRSWMAEK
jgi:flagellar M-ring protein FliF